MKLDLKALQNVVKEAVEAEKATDAFKAEVARAFGPPVVTEGRLEEVAARANDRLDVLDRTGRTGGVSFKTSVAARYLDHTDPEVRRFAARVVPERFLSRMTNDRDAAVRAAVAQRVPLNAVREMMKRFRDDDQLRAIFRGRRLHEAGLSQPKAEPMGHDPIDGAERMGDSARSDDAELSEGWYQQHAMRMLHDYGRNIEYAWEELAVRRFVSSARATSGMEIDEAKLLKAIKDLIKEKEDRAMERDALRETLAWLEAQEGREALAESALPNDGFGTDPVEQLLGSGLTNEQYVEQGKLLFKVQESTLPSAIRKHRFGEAARSVTRVPCVGRLPHSQAIRAVDERALDRFCEAWSDRQQISGEPLRLEWIGHPGDRSKVCFTCILK